MIFIIGIFFMGLSLFVGWRLKSKFQQYSQIPLASGMSGKDVAQRMLNDHGIYDVTVESVEGHLSDHYNPANKTVNLSPDVYHGRNAAAVAVAAHECGHAVQHATAYSMLQLRSAMVPIQNVSATVMNVVVMAMIFGSFAFSHMFPMKSVLLIIIGCNLVITLFAMVTLPVEFDASSRALAWIQEKRIVTPDEYGMAKDALKWAALTYVVGALASLANLLYYIMLFTNSRD